MGIGGISIWQILIILILVLLLFGGTKRIKSLGSDLAKTIKSFRKTMDEEDKDNELGPTGATESDAGWENTVATSAPSHIGPTGQDIHGGGDSGSSGSTGSMSASDFSDESPGTPFFKGGRVSYSKGGIASLWQR